MAFKMNLLTSHPKGIITISNPILWVNKRIVFLVAYIFPWGRLHYKLCSAITDTLATNSPGQTSSPPLFHVILVHVHSK